VKAAAAAIQPGEVQASKNEAFAIAAPTIEATARMIAANVAMSHALSADVLHMRNFGQSLCTIGFQAMDHWIQERSTPRI
jgi:hypothetical protein